MQNNRGTSVFKKSYLNDFIVIAIGVFFIAFFIRAWGDMHADFNEQNVSAINLDAWNLLYYSLRTSMRFLLGMAWSLLFSVVFAVLAARYTPLRRVILPFVNFMESVPLVGFLTFTTVYFLNLYPHSVMGLECTAIFAVFTGQAWNMMLTLYQTLRIVPKELDEAARSFNYNPWQRFWRLEFIYSVPGLLWNAMVSQSAAWFALVASEAIPVGDRSVESARRRFLHRRSAGAAERAGDPVCDRRAGRQHRAARSAGFPPAGALYRALQIRRRHRQPAARQSVVLQQPGLLARRRGARPHAARAG
ncbi:ABC transporter permease subunit [Serratia marcescens]